MILLVELMNHRAAISENQCREMMLRIKTILLPRAVGKNDGLQAPLHIGLEQRLATERINGCTQPARVIALVTSERACAVHHALNGARRMIGEARLTPIRVLRQDQSILCIILEMV
ncbi:hypothetical protein [Cystobacter ferrugineus]|uniref:hypothetical protein n=1 Tax=Cystobacter ferrugineus TaxID=83449 RepID=UPI001FE2504D|nr:hypothetical protein [Cystobacter ferrugineus]